MLEFFVGMKYMGWPYFWVGKEGARQVARPCVLGGKFGLPLLKGEVRTRGLGNSRFWGCLFRCYSTLYAKTHTSSKVEYCCN